ncbi:MAG: hypothetical protein AAGF27_06960 [Pseudomonadota bacterium]
MVSVLPQADGPALSLGRVHEIAGSARRSFAIWVAAQLSGPVFWIAPSWGIEMLNPDGVQAWIDPARLVFISPTRAEDLLWSMEEVLRAGAVTCAVVDLPALPSLTQVRRMHLAAENGGADGAHLPLGLLLTPGQGGASGVETRWNLTPQHHAGKDRWQLECLRARTSPPQNWTVQRNSLSLTAQREPA